MGVKIYKEKKVEHLLPGERANLYPAWRETYRITDSKLRKIRKAHESWIDHRNTANCMACKQGRDGGIYTCNELDSRDVYMGYLEEVLVKGRTLIKQISTAAFIPHKVIVSSDEIGDDVLVIPKGVVVTTTQLYDPDKDSQVQPPSGLASGFFTLAG
jgi:hypothetical protein